ncbi:MAG: hypothetical protein U0Q18_11325 [Bryobacteraceae bacterium]
MGDIVLQCTGKPGASITANLSVNLPATITNRVNANSFATDASLTLDAGTPMASGVSGLVTNQTIAFNGFQFVLPASGAATITLTNIRADIYALGLSNNSPIKASLSSNLPLDQNPVVVAYAQQGLLANNSSAAVTCTGSSVPSSVTVSSLFSAGTAEQTTRITEGFATSFQPKDPTSDSGTRILINYTGLPAGATVWVPDAVAGSSATRPTSGGDLGIPSAAGEYTPSSGTLLLVRVLNADASGTGGSLAALPAPGGSGAVILDAANPVNLTNGSGYVVYEVVDSNPSVRESAQIPSFFGIPLNSAAGVSSMTVSIAPVSAVYTASATAPIPRFASVQPPSDCSALGDCNASYMPNLEVNAQPVEVNAVVGGKVVTAGSFEIRNTSGGVMSWQAIIDYAGGSDWLVLSDYFGANSDTVNVWVNPKTLTAPGTYQATIVIDAGAFAGSKSIPVTVNVTKWQNSIVVSSVTNAADFHAGPVVPGSLATVWGTNFAGQNVLVAFDGTAAKLLYTGAKQINLRVPPELSGHTSSQMIVTVDGSSSAPMTVQLVPFGPAIFTPGVLNQNNTVNASTVPGPAGTVLQVFGTGIPDSNGTVSVKIQGHDHLVPLYAGAAPGLPGLQQVNVAIPTDVPAGASTLTICVTGPDNQTACSQPESIWVSRP